jgi:CheY-like chemotaxis protein
MNQLINGINELVEFAISGDESFYNEICRFLVRNFNLHSVSLFSLSDKTNLKLIGKSDNVTLEGGGNFSCTNCRVINNNLINTLNFDSNCGIPADTSKFNACLMATDNAGNRFVVSISKKSPIDKNDKLNIESASALISRLLSLRTPVHKFKQPSAEIYELINNFSDDIRNITNTIIGSVTLLSEKSDSGLKPENFSPIRRSAQSILLYLNDLKESTRILSGDFSVNKKDIEVTQVLEDLIKLFRHRSNNKFKFEVDLKIDGTIKSDEFKLRYVFSNLIYTASLLSTSGNFTVKGSNRESGGIEITLTASDTVGIPVDIIKNFFKPFVIKKINEIKNSNLTGLSLYLAKKYLNLLNGDISVVQFNNQLIFKITIDGAIMSDIDKTLSGLPKPDTENKVLVIEDDYATSKLLSNYLNKWGYKPIIVSTEQEAFDFINSESLLAVILDIELPNTNGLELLRKIHEHEKTKNVPVIVCSIEHEQQKAFMMGAVEYFVKPINYNYLVEVLTSYKLRKDSNILCVDDDVPTLNLVKQAIESAGFKPVAENVSANVMDLIKDKDIDLAIIDLDMPHPNGFELIKMIKSEPKFAHLPIIIYTGKENYQEDLKNIEGLFDDLLEKRSTNIEDLADTIRQMINQYEVPPPEEEVLTKKGVKKILLAEDYKHSQIIVTRLLKKNNFEDIVVVENGEDAVNMAKKEKFDLILMDMQMPIMNGFEATEKIRQMPEYKNVPIIALTAFAMKGDKEKCLEAGATDYIPKPIDSKEFIDKIKYYTNS